MIRIMAKTCTVAQAFNPSYAEAEAKGLRILEQLRACVV